MNSCQVCGNSSLFKVISLGNQPPSDAFLTDEMLKNAELMRPLEVFYCEKCKLVQLGEAIEPKILFGENYIYRSGFSTPLKNHFHELAKRLVQEFKLKEGDLVIDIGANDGTMLEGFMPFKVRTLGVEPSGVAKVAQEKGINIVKEFFGEETAKRIVSQYGKAKIITATNVFAHVRDLKSFVEGVKILLDDGGVFVTESHYLLKLVQNLEYDTIYHEHLRYYSVESSVNLFKMFGMDLFYSELVPTHGGSILLFACKKGEFPISNSVSSMLKIESDSKLNSVETFKELARRIEQNKKDLKDFLLKLKSEKKKIIGIGAPAKSTTLLNYCGIGPGILDYLTERSDWKIGRYSPGMHVKIIDEAQMFKDQPEYALMLSWNLKGDIIPKLRKNGYIGKIIVPIPSPIVED